MAGPTISSLLQKAGIAPAQTVGTKQAIDEKKKDGDPMKVVLDGDDGGDTVKSISEAAAKASKKRTAKRAKGESSGQGDQIQRRRVKLKDLAQREAGKQVSEKKQVQEKQEARTDLAPGFGAESEKEPAAETPKAKARRGLQKAVGRLSEQGRYKEIQVRYESARTEQEQGPGPVLSKTGQQKWMLTNLCDMLKICVEQHTGGAAGEAFESRRDTRLIYMALRGLSVGESRSERSLPMALSEGQMRLSQKKAQQIFATIIEPPMRPESMPEYYEVA